MHQFTPTIAPLAADDADRVSLRRYQRLRRLAIALLLVSVTAVLLFVRSALEMEWHEHVEQAGILLITTGIVGRLWSTLYVGGRKAAEIVRHGPYSIMRNPLYFFSSVAAAGVGAMTGSVSVALLFGVACALAFHLVILREERFLAAAFGAPYRDYLASVPRFFPDIRLYRDLDTASFVPHRLRQTLFDGLAFFLAFPLFELIEAGQDWGVLPVLLHLP